MREFKQKKFASRILEGGRKFRAKEDWNTFKMLQKYGMEFLMGGNCSLYKLIKMNELERYLNSYPFEERFDIIRGASNWNRNGDNGRFDFDCPYCLITTDDYHGDKIQSITEGRLDAFFYSCRNLRNMYKAGKEFQEYCIEKGYFEPNI